MLYRVLRQMCGIKYAYLMKNCDGFHLLHDDVCYPIRGPDWDKAFDEKIGDKLLQAMEPSTVVHFWNKLSKNEMLSCDSKAVSSEVECKQSVQLYNNFSFSFILN